MGSHCRTIKAMATNEPEDLEKAFSFKNNILTAHGKCVGDSWKKYLLTKSEEVFTEDANIVILSGTVGTPEGTLLREEAKEPKGEGKCIIEGNRFVREDKIYVENIKNEMKDVIGAKRIKMEVIDVWVYPTAEGDEVDFRKLGEVIKSLVPTALVLAWSFSVKQLPYLEKTAMPEALGFAKAFSFKNHILTAHGKYIGDDWKKYLLTKSEEVFTEDAQIVILSGTVGTPEGQLLREEVKEHKGEGRCSIEGNRFVREDEIYVENIKNEMKDVINAKRIKMEVIDIWVYPTDEWDEVDFRKLGEVVKNLGPTVLVLAWSFSDKQLPHVEKTGMPEEIKANRKKE